MDSRSDYEAGWDAAEFEYLPMVQHLEEKLHHHQRLEDASMHMKAWLNSIVERIDEMMSVGEVSNNPKSPGIRALKEIQSMALRGLNDRSKT